MTIKQEGTSSCYFMPRQKQPPPHTPVHMEINDDLTEEEASIIRAQIVEDDLSHTPDEGKTNSTGYFGRPQQVHG